MNRQRKRTLKPLAFTQDPGLDEQYKTFINEYVNMEHMQKINTTLQFDKEPAYYLPHHAVTKKAALQLNYALCSIRRKVVLVENY